MKIDLINCNIQFAEKKIIETLLKRKSNSINTNLEQMWFLMDLVWDDYGCNNRNLNWDKIGQFYAHPVWLLNGFFIEQDEMSMGHRHAISDWVADEGFLRIVDYGGGFGTLARLVAEKCTASTIDIYEPHPSKFALKRIEDFNNLNMHDKLKGDYNLLLSTDVLEHVADPLADFSTMIDSVSLDGYLVIANCFHPVIKCHLPQNFHFRFTFNLFAKLMGLENIGLLDGSHATIYKKKDQKSINWWLVRKVEVLSKFTFPLIQFAVAILRPIKRFVFK